MNYNFEFNSPVIGRIQSFEYSYATTNEYAFIYGRDISSDLSKFNAPIFVARKRQGLFSYDKIYFANKISKGFNINKNNTNKLKKEEENKGNIYKDILVKQDNKDIYISNKDIFGNKYIYLNILGEVFVKEYINNLNVFPEYLLEDCIPKKITITKLKSSTKEFELEKYDNFFLRQNNVKNTIIHKNILMQQPIKEIKNIYKDILLGKPINILSVYNNYMLLQGNENHANILDSYFVNKPIADININNNILINNANINKAFIDNGINICLNSPKEVIINKQINIKNNNVLKINLSDCLFMQNNVINDLYVNKNKLHGNINDKEIDLFNSILAGIQQKEKANIQYKIPKASKNKKRLIQSKDIILGYHSKRKANFRKGNLFAYKFNHNIFLEKNILLSKDKHKIKVNDTELRFFSIRKRFNIKNNSKFITKDKHNFSINNSEKYLDKSKHDFIINNFDEGIFKNKQLFSINNTKLFIKNAYKNFNIDDNIKAIYRDRYSMSISITEADLTKTRLPIDIITHDNTIGFIISEKEMYKENNYFLNTNSIKVFTENTTKWLEKENKKANTFTNNFFVLTKQRKIFLEYYHNFMLSKNTKKCLINISEQFVEKQIKNDIMYHNIINLTKHNKEVFIKNELNIIKNHKDLITNEELIKITKHSKKESLYNINISLNKIDKNLILTNSTWVNKNIYIMDIFSQENISKNIYEAYLENDNIFFDKATQELTKNIYFEVDTKHKGIFTDNNISITKEKKGINNQEQEYVLITKQQYETNPYVLEMKHMQKILKDLEKPIEKTYNWVYVYQYEDPIDPNYDYYGIDELLLPEKDIDYSTFESIIFDKKKMIPKSPVKIIDDNTFIAKYPIQHPTPKYEEVGIVYIDVPTELMYSIFIKFYQVWYANIFKFGNISMVDSLKLMLEYMYSYIVTTYSGTEYLEPALRVFRQIRWFGETSVMHNAQYKITCEYEDLKSNLQTGECMIKNELLGFYVNTQLKVLSTESTLIGQEAYIKLYASNKEDSQISFSISLTNGNVDVYINNIFIDTIYSNHAFIAYDLPATTTENIITLKRSANNNFGHCYVGNIIIKKGTYKNLNIEYDPDLKAGNMPLNDIVNKMVILANMYDDEQEAFEKFRKGNLAVSELYKKLESYWEMHHANKIKGKRLTIKET